MKAGAPWKAVEPCPFCAGASIFCLSVDLAFDNKDKHLICSSCGAAGPIGKNEDEAVEKWNWRETGGRLAGDCQL